jgi:hypothetical protein
MVRRGHGVTWHKFVTTRLRNHAIQSKTAHHAARRNALFELEKMVPEIGIEPTTYALRMRRSTN